MRKIGFKKDLPVNPQLLVVFSEYDKHENLGNYDSEVQMYTRAHSGP